MNSVEIIGREKALAEARRMQAEARVSQAKRAYEQAQGDFGKAIDDYLSWEAIESAWMRWERERHHETLG